MTYVYSSLIDEDSDYNYSSDENSDYFEAPNATSVTIIPLPSNYVFNNNGICQKEFNIIVESQLNGMKISQESINLVATSLVVRLYRILRKSLALKKNRTNNYIPFPVKYTDIPLVDMSFYQLQKKYQTQEGVSHPESVVQFVKSTISSGTIGNYPQEILDYVPSTPKSGCVSIFDILSYLEMDESTHKHTLQPSLGTAYIKKNKEMSGGRKNTE